MRLERFVVITPILCVAILALVALVNVAVDPYDVFGTRRLDGFNANKPKASARAPMVKAYQLARIRPRTLLLGTSRVDIGFDPQHSSWPHTAQPVYNYGFPGSSLRKIELQLRHAVTVAPIQRVVIGLEFQEMLNPRLPPVPPPGEFERRISTPEVMPGMGFLITQRLLDSTVSTLTLKATMDSFATVLSQRKPNVVNVAENGLTNQNLLAGYARADGYGVLFEQTNRNVIRSMDRDARTLAPVSSTEFPDLVTVRSISNFCRSAGIELHWVLPPYHADYLEIIDAAGLWTRFENLKVALSALADEFALQQSASAVTFWDFASYDPLTTEAVPEIDDRRSELRWFWESAHFKKALGDEVLSRLLGGGNDDSFGVELKSSTVGLRLQSTRAARSAYRLARPEARKRIELLLREVRHSNKSSIKDVTSAPPS